MTPVASLPSGINLIFNSSLYQELENRDLTQWGVRYWDILNIRAIKQPLGCRVEASCIRMECIQVWAYKTGNYVHLKSTPTKCQSDISRCHVLKRAGDYLWPCRVAFFRGYVIPWCGFDDCEECCQFRKHLERKLILISMDIWTVSSLAVMGNSAFSNTGKSSNSPLGWNTIVPGLPPKNSIQ